MTAINDLSHKEWVDLVAHPNTTRADAIVAFCSGEPLDFNPYDKDNPKYQWWEEGYNIAKNDKFHLDRRERYLKWKKDKGHE